MKALLFLSVVGAALYGLLLLTDEPVLEGKHRTANAQPNPAVRSLGSWGPYLPAVLIERRASDGFQVAERKPRNDPVHISEPKSEAKADSVKSQDMRVAQMVLGARVHSMPSRSSPTVQFFSPGSKLQMLNEENGWVELIDPATQEHGWVIKSYILLTRTATRSQDILSKPQPTKPVLLTSKQRSRSPKAAPQQARKFVPKTKVSPAQKVIHDERPRRLGLFGRRFAIFNTPVKPSCARLSCADRR
jgi:hypothetical protein